MVKLLTLPAVQDGDFLLLKGLELGPPACGTGPHSGLATGCSPQPPALSLLHRGHRDVSRSGVFFPPASRSQGCPHTEGLEQTVHTDGLCESSSKCLPALSGPKPFFSNQALVPPPHLAFQTPPHPQPSAPSSIPPKMCLSFWETGDFCSFPERSQHGLSRGQTGSSSIQRWASPLCTGGSMKGADIPRTHQENDPSTQLRLFWEAFCSRENPVSCTVLAGALALCGGARRF